MGLASAPSTLQRMIENLLRGLMYLEILVYLDDIIVYAKDLKDRERKLDLLFERLGSANQAKTRKDPIPTYRPKQEESFQTLKQSLVNHPILIHSNFEKKLTLTTDDSDFTIGAVLRQEKDEFDHLVAYLIRALNKAGINYSTTEKECFAALYAMRQFQPYLISQKFILQSDHEPIN